MTVFAPQLPSDGKTAPVCMFCGAFEHNDPRNGKHSLHDCFIRLRANIWAKKQLLQNQEATVSRIKNDLYEVEKKMEQVLGLLQKERVSDGL